MYLLHLHVVLTLLYGELSSFRNPEYVVIVEKVRVPGTLCELHYHGLDESLRTGDNC